MGDVTMLSYDDNRDALGGTWNNKLCRLSNANAGKANLASAPHHHFPPPSLSHTTMAIVNHQPNKIILGWFV